MTLDEAARVIAGSVAMCWLETAALEASSILVGIAQNNQPAPSLRPA